MSYFDFRKANRNIAILGGCLLFAAILWQAFVIPAEKGKEPEGKPGAGEGYGDSSLSAQLENIGRLRAAGRHAEARRRLEPLLQKQPHNFYLHVLDRLIRLESGGIADMEKEIGASVHNGEMTLDWAVVHAAMLYQRGNQEGARDVYARIYPMLPTTMRKIFMADPILGRLTPAS